MNKKQLKARLYPIQFKKQYQARIHATVENSVGIPAVYLCVFIARLGERISQGRLSTQEGLLIVSDRGMQSAPIIMAHCWNTIGGRRIDLSPWSECPFPVEYVTDKDEKYEFYRKQTSYFEQPPEDLLEEDVTRLMQVFHQTSVTISNDILKKRLIEQTVAACSGEIPVLQPHEMSLSRSILMNWN